MGILAVGVSVHFRRAGPDDSYKSLPTQTILQFYDFDHYFFWNNRHFWCPSPQLLPGERFEHFSTGCFSRRGVVEYFESIREKLLTCVFAVFLFFRGGNAAIESVIPLA